ncbi:MAG: helix-turn-helix domain-containing protein [Lachnospiraceae bacterium]
MDLKERIQVLCKKKNISLNQLEHELGFGKGYISKLGKSTPNTTKIKKIADRLSVTVDYLMTGEESPQGITMHLSDEDQMYVEVLKKLKEKGISFEKLEAYIEAAENLIKDKK